MTHRIARPLAATGIVVLVVIVMLSITGWIIVATSHSPGRHSFAVTVLDDRDTPVAIQPCARYFCNKFDPVELAAGASHTWQTSDGDDGIESFAVEDAPNGRILGCLAQHGLTPLNGRVVVRVSDLETCAS